MNPRKGHSNRRADSCVFRRCEGNVEAVETPIGLLPVKGAINAEGLDIPDAAMDELLSVDAELLREQLPQIEEHFTKLR